MVTNSLFRLLLRNVNDTPEECESTLGALSKLSAQMLPRNDLMILSFSLLTVSSCKMRASMASISKISLSRFLSSVFLSPKVFFQRQQVFAHRIQRVLDVLVYAPDQLVKRRGVLRHKGGAAHAVVIAAERFQV